MEKENQLSQDQNTIMFTKVSKKRKIGMLIPILLVYPEIRSDWAGCQLLDSLGNTLAHTSRRRHPGDDAF